eukprot:s558_g34.t1
MAPRRTSTGRGLALVVLSAVIALFGRGWTYTAPLGGGLTRKQKHGSIHNKDKLEGPTLEDLLTEVQDEEEEPEMLEKPPMPERRVPYSMHIVTQLPQHKHLHEESNARRYIEEKLILSLENFEDFIRQRNVNLQVSENFHREKRPDKAKAKGDIAEIAEDDVVLAAPDSAAGHKMLTPYIFKATVTLTNHHKVTLSNPEKHAQPTLTEAADHMVDVLRKALREEKNRMIAARSCTWHVAHCGTLTEMCPDFAPASTEEGHREGAPR